MKKVILKKNEDRRIRTGHLWVFSNELQSPSTKIEKGELVEILSYKNQFIGIGFYNPNSLIAVRVLSFKSDFLLNKEILFERISKANNLRKTLFPEREAYRMVFGESDFLPGLIIDKYNNSFVLQIFSAGFEMIIPITSEILIENFHAENIIIRNDFSARELENLPQYKKQIFGDKHKEIINDGILNFEVDLLNGQKTGTFFDQTLNRHSIITISNGLKVLDCFCNDGGFSLAALKGGANNVTSVDSSQQALSNFESNLALNNFNKSNIKLIFSDVFGYLKNAQNSGEKFDMIILDPPSFTKSKKNLNVAKKGYYTLNSYALQILKEGGYLVTASCSHHINDELFVNILSLAARKNQKIFRVISNNTAAPDHPIYFQMPETKYLKFTLLKVNSLF